MLSSTQRQKEQSLPRRTRAGDEVRVLPLHPLAHAALTLASAIPDTGAPSRTPARVPPSRSSQGRPASWMPIRATSGNRRGARLSGSRGREEREPAGFSGCAALERRVRRQSEPGWTRRWAPAATPSALRALLLFQAWRPDRVLRACKGVTSEIFVVLHQTISIFTDLRRAI